MAGEINLNHICKIEGHASLNVKIENGEVLNCALKTEEGARFFEGLVLGKRIEDIQEIVSRICGICSSSHGVAAINALENALEIKPTEREKIIRRLLMIGERIRSHTTHIYFLSLPDYLGIGALTMAKSNKEEVDDALEIIKAGNKIVEVFGGREMHPFVKFHSDTKDFEGIKDLLEKTKSKAEKTIKLFSSLKYPKFERNVSQLCLREEDEYALISGEIVSHCGSIKTADYKKHLSENIKEYATSKFVLHDNKPYLTGASARINVNSGSLDEETKRMIKKYEIKLPLNNPFLGNIARAIEIYSGINESLDLIKNLEKNNERVSKWNIVNRNGRGVSAVEAPRGTLFHEYEIKDGKIVYCNILTPTAQNLNQIEEDIKNYVQKLIEAKMPKEKIALEIEKLIRSFDPCFSCSTHFLRVNWEDKI